MALIINTDNYELDVSMYEKEIGKTGFDIYIDMPVFLSHFMEVVSNVYNIEYNLTACVGYFSAGQRFSSHKDNVIYALRYMGVPENIFKTKARDSLNMNSTIPAILKFCEQKRVYDAIRADNIKFICDEYCKLSMAKTHFASLNSIQERLNDTELVGTNGQKLKTISSMYTKKATGRYYTESYNLQGWNKQSINCFTVPKDYYLVWADFEQIDFRVACNLLLLKDNPELQEMFNNIPDKYEGFCRMLYKSAGLEFNMEEFKENRSGFKEAILASLYGAGYGTLTKYFKNDNCAKILSEYFDNNPARNDYISRLKNALYYLGEVQCKDYFGQVNRVAVSQKADEFTKGHELKSLVNNPVQSTSNSLIMTWCNEIIKRFRSLGFNRDMFKVYLNRHDEIVIMAHKSTLEYSWIFKDYSEMAVDDWTILEIEPSFGYNYKVVDDSLTEEYKKSCEKFKHKITPYKQGKARNSKYCHCKKVITLTSLAPVTTLEFIILYHQNTPFFKPYIEELKSTYRNDLKGTLKRSAELLRQYVDTISDEGKQSVAYNFTMAYREYSSVYFYKDECNNIQSIKHNELINFLKNNDYGYVTILNGVKDDYSIIDDIQFRFTKLYDEIGLITTVKMYDESC